MDEQKFVRGGFLCDGRVVLVRETGGHAMLTLYSADGQPQREVDLGEYRRPLLAGEPMPGWLAVAVRPPGKSAWNSGSETFEPRGLLLVDLATGRIQRQATGSNLQPAASFYSFWFSSDAAFTAVPGGTLSRLFLEKEGEQYTLLELDPIKDTRRVVFKTRP
jgi:hypothetical protein